MVTSKEVVNPNEIQVDSILYPKDTMLDELMLNIRCEGWRIDSIHGKNFGNSRGYIPPKKYAQIINRDLNVVTIKNICDKLRFITRFFDMNKSLQISVEINNDFGFDMFHGVNPKTSFDSSIYIEAVSDDFIMKHFKFAGWSKKSIKKLEDEQIEPLFQKIFCRVKHFFKGRIEFIYEPEQIHHRLPRKVKVLKGSTSTNVVKQPKQSISYQLGEEVIEAELIENEVVEVKSTEVNHNPNIQTYKRNNQSYFNARDIHKQLGVKSSFSSWMKAKKRKHLLEQAIQTIEFRSGRNTRSVDWLIPIELMDDLVHSIAK